MILNVCKQHIHAIAHLGIFWPAGNINRNNHIRTKAACHLDRDRAGQATVNIFTPIDADRLKNTGHAAGSPHRRTCIAAPENRRLSVAKIGCHSSKCFSQTLDRFVLQSAVNKILQQLALDESPVGQGPVAHAALVELEGNFLQFKTTVTSGVKGAHHTSGTGSNHDLRINSMRLKCFEHADMGKPSCRSAAQSNGNFRSNHFGRHDGLGFGLNGRAA